MNAAYNRQVKCLCLVGENPFLGDPDATHVEDALRKLKFFAVQDIFLTETAKLTHVFLPAISFAKKDGTFINTERRVQLVYEFSFF
jgi:predicted molibdopterin-dependent oxidoreductase YjgC